MKSQTYGALHRRMRRIIPKPEFCSSCGKNKTFDLANISQKYLDDIKDWEYLCRSCHMTKDNRLVNLKKHKPTGEKNHFWKGGKKVFLRCLCGKDFFRYKCRMGLSKSNFCSNSCKNKYRNK